MGFTDALSRVTKFSDARSKRTAGRPSTRSPAPSHDTSAAPSPSLPEPRSLIQIQPPSRTDTPLSSMATHSTPPKAPAPSLALNVLVLLPASAHMQRQPAPIAPVRRPPSLATRQSGSTVATLNSLRISPRVPQSDSVDSVNVPDAPEASLSDLVAANRRLSLAPGMGSGTQTRSPRSNELLQTTKLPSPPEVPTVDDAVSPLSTRAAPPVWPSAEISGPPAFGARLSAAQPRGGRRRPNTASNEGPQRAMNTMARGSLALPSGMGLGMGSSKTRPGWEGDEVVGMLRLSGTEVTVIRSLSQLPTVLSPETASPALPSFAATFTASLSSETKGPDATPVVLVPLCDSPSLPSLSLLLSQGTTPTAVCFQQDLLDRAKRTEDEWLPAALEKIRLVAASSPAGDANGEDRSNSKLVVIAYSANQTLSGSTISACVAAGASGVLKPPYDLETARLVRRMTRAALSGRISSVVGVPVAADPSSPIMDDDVRVVLPPVALPMGDGEHETERALSSHRRGMSQQWDSLSPPSGSSELPGAPVTPMTALPTSAAATIFEARRASRASIQSAAPLPRRRSVDLGGLTVAMTRAQLAFEASASALASASASASASAKRSARARSPLRDEDDMHVAELLGTMYHQTCQTIDVEMDDYAALSSPLDQAHRDRLVDALATWSFKPHQLDDGDLYRAACLVFETVLRIEGVAELQLDTECVNRLLFAIRAIYHAPNPYHNYVHAIDVLQATYSFLFDIGVVPPWDYMRRAPTAGEAPWRQPDEETNPVHGLGTRRAREVLRPQDVFSVIVAAMGHDVGHPGLSNAFMKNAKTPLSEVYEDKSVLENMHCMLVIQLLRRHGFSFLFSGPRAAAERLPARRAFDAKAFRQVLYSSVLATDMSLHFAWIAQLKAFGERVEKGDVGAKEGEAGGVVDEKDRVLICQSIIKCADISNPTRPIDVSEHWSTVLLEEWAKQASLETDLSLPVSVIASADQALQAKGQIGFIDLFTQPLFETVSDVLPELQKYADSCAENRGIWAGRLEALQAAETTELVQPVIEAAAADARFKTLFPMSLPRKLTDALEVREGYGQGGAQPVRIPGFAGGLGAGAGDEGVPSLSSTPSTAIPSSSLRSHGGQESWGSTVEVIKTPPSSYTNTFGALLVPAYATGSSPSEADASLGVRGDTARAHAAGIKALRAVYHASRVESEYAQRRAAQTGRARSRGGAAVGWVTSGAASGGAWSKVLSSTSGLGHGMGGPGLFPGGVGYERRASTPDAWAGRGDGLFGRRFLALG